MANAYLPTYIYSQVLCIPTCRCLNRHALMRPGATAASHEITNNILWSCHCSTWRRNKKWQEHMLLTRRVGPPLSSRALCQKFVKSRNEHNVYLLYLYLFLSLSLRLCYMFCAIYLQMQLKQQHYEQKQRRLIKPNNQSSKSGDGKKFLLCNGIKLFEWVTRLARRYVGHCCQCHLQFTFQVSSSW